MGGALIGRERELALLGQLSAGLSQASAVVVVRGEAGIGKTVLVRAAADDAEAAGQRILSGACAPLSGAVAYGGLDRALAVGQEPGGTAFTSVAAGRAWTVGSLLRTLGELAERGAVLVVEDVHWADSSTLDFLAHLSRNLPTQGLLVLLTWRDEDTDAEHARWLGEQLRSPSVIDLPLRRLTREETVRQLPDCSAELVSAVYHRSAGNPYLSAELAIGHAQPSESLRQVLGSRLDAVESSARTVVAATATLGRALDDDELLAAASGSAEAVWAVCDAGLVLREPGRGATARHPVLAELAYERLLSRDRRELHLRLAAHLKAALPDRPTAAAVAEVADQYRRAEAADDGLVWAVRAAAAAEKGFAIAEAGHWYAEAAALWDAAGKSQSDVPEKLALLTSAASHLASVGQTAQAMELLAGDLATMSATDEEVVRAAIARSWLGTTVGDTEQALRDVELARRLTPAHDEQTRARICAAEAMALGTCSRWDEALEPARTALDLGTKCGDTRTVGMAHALLGTLSALDGRLPGAIAHHQAALVIAYRLSEPEDLAIAGVLLTDVALRLGEPDRAMKVAGVVGPEVQRLLLGRHWLEDLMDSNVIQALYQAGRWDEALAWVSDPLTLSDLGFVQLMLSEINLARGDVSLAKELLAQAASLGERDQPMFAVAYAQCRARLLLETGRADEALEVAVSMVGAAEAAIDSREEPGLLLVGVEAAATVGAPDRLEELAALLGGATKGRLGAAVAATFEAERTRAMGASDPDRWLAAAGEWAAAGQPFEEARVRRRAAEAMLVSRPGAAARQAAAEQLTTASQLADRLGAAPLRNEIGKLARLARIDLGRPDQADVHPHTVQDLALTDREHQVLALLADGRTNREIGDALYMSPKTASVHVTHILEKLGVQSRVQAAAVAVRLGLDEPRQN